MLAMVFLLAWNNFGRPRHALTWSWAFLAGTLPFTLTLFSDSVLVDDPLHWVISTALSVLPLSLLLAGFRQWAGKPVQATVIALTGFTAAAMVTLFTYGYPHTGLRLFVGPAYAGAICLLNARIVLGHNERHGNIPKAVATVLGAFGGAQILAGLIALMQGPEFDARWLETYKEIHFVTLPAGFLGCGLFMVLVLASDLAAQMRKLARTDTLTGLLNRRGFDEFSSPLLPRARRSKQAVSVILCDVDHFRRINDQYGHNAGDHVLKALARFLSEGLRDGDVFGRFGGEKFALALPGTDLKQAAVAGERLREILENNEIGWRPEPLQITASFGISCLREDDHTMDDVLRRAERALATAKKDGRNRVCVEQSAAPQ